jgi:hypothetical protein
MAYLDGAGALTATIRLWFAQARLIVYGVAPSYKCRICFAGHLRESDVPKG